MKQCAVLFVDTRGQPAPHAAALREMGFIVDECLEWPHDGAIRDHHVLVVRAHAGADAPMIAARLRAKPHFGRRLLLALVPRGTGARERRSLEASGFDEILGDGCDSRTLAGAILREMRHRPDLQCVAPSLRRRSAA